MESCQKIKQDFSNLNDLDVSKYFVEKNEHNFLFSQFYVVPQKVL